MDRQAASTRTPEKPSEYDLFLSHAHADSDVAEALSKWLTSLWPELRVARTDPSNERAFREDPTYFFTLARKSQCVLYLVTPNSIDRPMVDTEIGCSANKPILSVLLGGTTIDELRKKIEESLFLSLDLDLATAPTAPSDWTRLVKLLAEALAVTSPSGFDPPVLPAVPPYTADEAGQASAFFADWLSVASHAYGIQDVDEADRAITEVLLANAAEDVDATRATALLQTTPPQLKLLMLLETQSEEAWKRSLEVVPALLDDKVLALLDLRRKEAASEEDADRLARIEPVLVQEILEKKLRALPIWSVYRGETFLEEIGVHPKALEYFDHVSRNACDSDFDFGFHKPRGDPPLRSIGARVPHGNTGKDWFIEGLAQRIHDAASQSVHSRVLYCTTDFHSGRLANLVGSGWLEAKENNPWMGARGMIRYLQPAYEEVFDWELEACRRASAEGMSHIAVLFPLVRSPEELVRGIQRVVAARLRPWGVGMIPEAPTNIVNAGDFLSTGCNPGSGFKQMLFIELAPLARAHQLGPVSAENRHGLKILGRVLMTFVNEARRFERLVGRHLGVSIELGMSHQDLTLLESVRAQLTLAVAGELSFLAD